MKVEFNMIFPEGAKKPKKVNAKVVEALPPAEEVEDAVQVEEEGPEEGQEARVLDGEGTG